MISSLSSPEYFFCCVVFYHMERRWKVSQDLAWGLHFYF